MHWADAFRLSDLQEQDWQLGYIDELLKGDQ